ncbi:MAG: methyltransferase [Geodermatophilaceae bacterium]
MAKHSLVGQSRQGWDHRSRAPMTVASHAYFSGLPMATGQPQRPASCASRWELSALDSFVRFALEGRGTPAPIAPIEQLGFRGLYRWFRNPMYVAVLLVIIGEGLVFANPLVLGYSAVLVLVVSRFVRRYEEPTLSRRYGTQYAA